MSPQTSCFSVKPHCPSAPSLPQASFRQVWAMNNLNYVSSSTSCSYNTLALQRDTGPDSGDFHRAGKKKKPSVTFVIVVLAELGSVCCGVYFYPRATSNCFTEAFIREALVTLTGALGESETSTFTWLTSWETRLETITSLCSIAEALRVRSQQLAHAVLLH